MRFEYTDGSNKDFIQLCHELDNFLNELVGREENRAQYIPCNPLDDIPIGCASFKKYDDECAKLSVSLFVQNIVGKVYQNSLWKN